MAPALVSATAANGNSGTSFGITIPSTTAGNLLVAYLVTYTSAANPTLNVPSGWTALSQVNQDIFINISTRAYYLPNCAGGTTSLTFTSSAGVNGWGLLVMEYSGVVTTSPLDTSTSGAPGTGAYGFSATLSPANSGDLMVGLYYVDLVAGNVPSPVTPTSWTRAKLTTDGPGDVDIVADYATGQNTYAPTWDTTGNKLDYAYYVLAFTAAGGGGSIVNGTPTFASNSILLDGMTPTPGNSALVVAAQIVETAANPAAEIGNSVLAEREVYEQGNSALAVTGAVILAPATLASNAALAVSALIITPATLASNATLAESGQIVAPATQAGASILALPDAQIVAPATFASNSLIVVTSEATFTSNAALAVSGAVVVAVCAAIANATLTQSAAQVQAPAALAGYSAVAEAAQIVAGAIAAQGNSALGQAQIAQPGSCAVSAVALGTVTLTAVALGTVALTAAVAE